MVGKYLYVYGDMDDDGFYEGKQMISEKSQKLSCMVFSALRAKNDILNSCLL